jgi:hypothetical protein
MSNKIDYFEDPTTGELFIEVNGYNKSGTENNLTISQTKNVNDEIVYEISQKLGKSKRLSAFELSEEEFTKLRLLMWKMEDDVDDD